MRLSCGVFGVVILAGASLISQSATPVQLPAQPAARPGQVTPPRASPGDPQTRGTAIIRGSVAAAETGAPIRRAQVRATSQDGRGTALGATDAEGKFELRELVAGRYGVFATKGGFVTAQYGQRRWDAPGQVLEIAEGQIVERVAITLPRGGVITGRVIDEFGEGVAGVQVSGMRSRFSPAGNVLSNVATDTTDDTGAFRVYGLPSGEFVVSAVLRNMTLLAPNTSSTEAEGYAPTYYPGTLNPGEAQRISVRVGQEHGGVVIPLASTRVARVHGRVVNSTGAPVAGAMLNLRPNQREVAVPTAGEMAQTRADGTFQFIGVTPGRYTLIVPPRGQGAASELGVADVTIGAGNVEERLVVTAPGGIARGVVTTDDGTPLPMKPGNASVFAPLPVPVQVPNPGGFGTVNEDWSFEITGLFDWRLFRMSFRDAAGWTLKAVRLNGQDITDTPLPFASGEVREGLEIVLSRKTTLIQGTVTDERGRPDVTGTVVVFPEDSGRWTPSTRFISTGRPNQDGRYEIKGLPPFENYFVVAVDFVEPGRWFDPEWLARVRSQASRISLGEGETRVQDLKIQKAP